MKILLVTGRTAASEASKQAEKIKADVLIHVCSEDVAAFLSVEDIAGELSKKNLKGVSQIIIPGVVRGDAMLITRRLKIPCFKGPRNVADLPAVMEKVMNKEIKLSSTTPADALMQKDLLEGIEKELEEIYKKPGKHVFAIGRREKVFLGSGISHVVAELIDAPLLTSEELIKRAQYYLACRAEIIDIGMIAGRDDSEKVGDMVDALRCVTKAPLSIDSVNEKEILCAADSGIDLVLSIDSCNVRVMDSIDVPCVLIPGDRKGRVPHASLERIRILEELIGKAGDKKVIADPILQPVNAGFTESVKAYAVFREKHPTIPLLLGAGNVTELLDADSPGVNALLAGIASELDVDLLFTTEASPKTRGSVEELATAARLMYLSKTRKQSPKDLGIDLLFLKDKRKSEQPTDPAEKGIISFEALKRPADKLDDRYYRIYVTDRINAVCYIDKKPLLRITGDKAENIYKELIARGLIKDPGHSAYLGKELYKAETALRLGKNYVQDGELFREG